MTKNDTTNDTDVKAITSLIDAYAEGVQAADVDAVRAVFAPDAHMYGWLGDDAMSVPIEAFLDVVRDSAADENRAAGYTYEIVDLRVTGRMAVATFHESGYLGQRFANTLTFLWRDGAWQAVSKTFVSPPE